MAIIHHLEQKLSSAFFLSEEPISTYMYSKMWARIFYHPMQTMDILPCNAKMDLISPRIVKIFE